MTQPYNPRHLPSLLGTVQFPEASHCLWDHCVNIYPADKNIPGPAVTWWNEQSWGHDQTNPTYGESCDCTPQPWHYQDQYQERDDV